jgi:hypothetical protein
MFKIEVERNGYDHQPNCHIWDFFLIINLLYLKKTKGCCKRLRLAIGPKSGFHSPLLATNIIVEGLQRVALGFREIT